MDGSATIKSYSSHLSSFPPGTAEEVVSQPIENKVIGELYALTQLENKTSNEIFDTVLNAVISNFDSLNQLENKPNNTSPIPANMQEALVILIMSGKNQGEVTISQNDIITTLDNLKGDASSEIQTALTKYTENDIEFLLTKGVELYNSKTAKKISLNTAVYTTSLPSDMQNQVMAYLPFTNKINLSKISKDQYQCWHGRSIASDPKGIQHLKSLGIDGPLLRQKIKIGELTIEQAQQVRAENLKSFQQALANTDLPKDYQQKLLATKKYIIDGSLTITQAINLSDRMIKYLNLEVINQSIDNEIITLKEVLTISNEVMDGTFMQVEGRKKYESSQGMINLMLYH